MSGMIHFYKKQSSVCISCGKCCDCGWPVPVTSAEVARISALDFSDWNGRSSSYFKKTLRGSYLRKRADKRCVFLDSDGLCIIHKKFGFDAKPLACRLYPLDVYKWRDGSVSASFRYDCPAVAGGSRMEHPRELANSITAFASELFQYRGRDADASYSRRIHPEIGRLRQIAGAYQRILLYDRIAPEVRFYAAVRLLLFHSIRKNSSDILEAEEFENDAFAFFKRSIEHLTSIVESAEKIRRDQLVRFRYLIWCVLRDDSRATLAAHFPMAFAALRFLVGRGTLKQSLLNLEVTAGDLFHQVCRCRRKADALEPFFRFLRGRLTSMHFCGSPALGLTYEYGMAYLLMTFPIVIFLASVLAAQRKELLITAADVSEALILTDHGFLRSKLFTRRSTKSAAWNLMKGEDYAFLMKLCLRQKLIS